MNHKMTTDTMQSNTETNQNNNNNQQQQQQGMLLLEPYQPIIFMEDDWENSLPALTNDNNDNNQVDDLFADMDFVDVSFPPTPSNSAPQSPAMSLEKSTSSAEELLSMLVQTYCPQILTTAST